MKSYEIECLFIDFFNKNGYITLPEIPLISKNDNNLLFTNSGMVQFKDIFLGNNNIIFDKVVTVQNCLRLGGKHNDFKNIGLSNHHNTSFKMLGNFGFNYISKFNVLNEAWIFLTKYLELDYDKLYVSIDVSDIETQEIWKQILGSNKNIFLTSDSSNFWSMDKIGPCGFCTEIFYDFDNDLKNLLEIWNLVFIQFDRNFDGSLNKLNSLFLDTGMGLERITSIKQKTFNNFKTDIYSDLINCLKKSFNLDIGLNKYIKILVDHLKSISLLFKENLYPGNDKRGYILKKLVRRCIISKNKLSVKKKLFEIDNDFFIKFLNISDIFSLKEILKIEEDKFSKTLSYGTFFFNKLIKKKKITSKDIFKLYDTYGMPLDLVKKLCKKHNVFFSMKKFNNEMYKQILISKNKKISFDINNLKNVSKTIFEGYKFFEIKAKILNIFIDNISVTEINFDKEAYIIFDKTCFYSEKGGQVSDIGIGNNNNSFFNVYDVQDFNGVFVHRIKLLKGSLKVQDDVNLFIDKINRNNCSNNHSATHLLYSVLKKILGTHVKQMGSLINSDYLRFDFTHFHPLRQEEISKIEKVINVYIRKGLKVRTSIEFDKLKNDYIRTVCIGNNISKELCAGTHVKNTIYLKYFKIVKEYGIGSNVRRIEALTGDSVIKHFESEKKILNNIMLETKSNKSNVFDVIKQALDNLKKIEKENEALATNLILNKIDSNKDVYLINDLKILFLENFKYYKLISKIVLNITSLVIINFIFNDNSNRVYINISKKLSKSINLLDLFNYLKNNFNIKGGGNSFSINFIIDTVKIYNDILNFIKNYFNNKLIS